MSTPQPKRAAGLLGLTRVYYAHDTQGAGLPVAGVAVAGRRDRVEAHVLRHLLAPAVDLGALR